MITIFHGDNTQSAREQFAQERLKLQNSSTFQGAGLTKNDLINFFEGGNLFFTDKNLVIENLLSRNKASKGLDEVIDSVNSYGKNSEILLWEEKEITIKSLSKFPKANIQTFKIPKLIFNFLDEIMPGNGENLVVVFHKVIENTPVELVLFMVVRHLRIMLALTDSKNSETIDELNKMAPWQRGKLEKQASLFSQEKLTQTYYKLYELDSFQKTGKLNMPISSAIDILLLGI